MTRRSRHAATSWPLDPCSTWTKLARQSAEMMFASGEVIARRSQRMAIMGAVPDAADKRELTRMVDEKVNAASDSLQAMTSRATHLYQGSLMDWLDLATRQTAALYGMGSAPRLDNSGAALARRTMKAAVAIASAGLAPYHQRATGNVRRLRK